MKRTALRRRTPMKRSASLQRAFHEAAASIGASRKRSAYAKRPRAVAFMLWVKSQPCVLRLAFRAAFGGLDPIGHRCEGPIEADHAGDRVNGSFRKSLDRDCIPLCQLGHRQRHDHRGPFADFNAERMRAFRRSAVTLTHARARAQGVEIPSC